MADHNWKVGQTVYVVPGKLMSPYETTIAKVGRQWGTLDHGLREARFDLRSGRLDNNRGIAGRVYESREAYEAEAAREKAWREFCHVVSGCHYAPATLGAIETARELLFGARVKEASNG